MFLYVSVLFLTVKQSVTTGAKVEGSCTGKSLPDGLSAKGRTFASSSHVHP